MRAVLDRSDDLVMWAAERIENMGGAPFSDGARAIGVESDDGRMLGVVVFSDYYPQYGTMQVSFAADDPRWLRARGAIETMHRYAFETCGVHKLWSLTPVENARALRAVVRGFGFTPEAVLEHQFGVGRHAMLSRKFAWEWRRQ
jgi:RimJ/RimL family protein N-acetyltransferase